MLYLRYPAGSEYASECLSETKESKISLMYTSAHCTKNEISH